MSPFSLTYITTRLNTEEFVQGIFGGDEHTEAVLQRLDRLTLDEARITAEEILKVVYGLVQDMSKQTYCARLSLALITFPARRQSIRRYCPGSSWYVLLVTTNQFRT